MGRNLFRSGARSLALRRALEVLRSRRKTASEPLLARLDDYAMAFDLLSRLTNLESEEAAVAGMREIFAMLFAPARLDYRPAPAAEAQGLESNAGLSDGLLAQGHERLPSGRGFRVLVRRADELFGVLEADDLAFPAYLERYLDLAPLVAGTCGLTMANARARQGRLRAEEELRQGQERFRLAFSTSPDAININRLEDGLYVEVNRGFTELTGYTQDDVKGKTSLELDIWADPADRQTLVRGLRERGFYENLEAKFRKKDGDLITALMSARVILLAGVPHTISITRDISERIRIQEEKAGLQAQLRQAQKMEAIGTLAGGIAHDFNNILAAIMGYAEIAHEEAKDGQANPADLEQIIKSAQRAKELVQQILAFSRKKEPDLRPLDLNQVVRRTQDILERTLPKMIGIETALAGDLPPILADPTQIEQVLLNLSSNAQDAMPEGGNLVMETRLAVLDHEYCRRRLEVRPGTYALLMVSDTGEGMSEEVLGRIFDPFFTTKEIGKGTGLGLSSVYGIVKNHGGHLHCYSEVGKGTIFRIYFPVFREDKPEPPAAPSPLADEGLTGAETILLVDDEEALRELGSRALKGMGYKVLTATSGEEALEVYRAQGSRLDLVVMDLGMPGMGGHKALRAILEIDPRARVIIASGYSAKGQVKASLESGAAGYVAKPFRRTELLGTVREVLDRT